MKTTTLLLVLVAAAGCSHDKPVEAKTTPDREKQRSVTSVEKEKFGMDHAEVGGRLLNRWNFATNVVAAVRFHHHPGAAGEHKLLAAVIHSANLISFYMNQGSGHDSYVRTFDRNCIDDTIDLTPKTIEEQYVPQVREAFQKELQLSLGIQSAPQ